MSNIIDFASTKNKMQISKFENWQSEPGLEYTEIEDLAFLADLGLVENPLTGYPAEGNLKS